MKLTDEQKHAALGILKNIRNNQIVTCGGHAGTGKTFLISFLNTQLPNFAVCAFTGKAANILRKKGIKTASTIHKLIYKPLVDENGQLILDSNGSPIFQLATSLDCDGIIVDEASMVSKEIYRDLCSFGLPIIFGGDHGQLEPIGEGINLMKAPDFRLEKIHRNAGPIASFAEFIRKGFRPAAYEFQAFTDKIHFINKNNVNKHLLDVEQTICAYNKTRVEINKKVRKLQGRVDEWPVESEKLMCLRNDSKKGLFNGMQGLVTKKFESPRNRMVFDSDGMAYDVLFDPTQLNKEKYDFSHNRDDPAPFDYGYCITCHKAQGDEWGSVMVIEQKCDLWEHKRWAYTAASRAKEKLIWAS